MAAKYDELKSQPPVIFNSDHFYDWDTAMQQLSIADHILQKCERCNMPVQEERARCDALCEFFQGLNQEWRGTQAVQPVPLKS